jgi:hypothetical protein
MLLQIYSYHVDFIYMCTSNNSIKSTYVDLMYMYTYVYSFNLHTYFKSTYVDIFTFYVD